MKIEELIERNPEKMSGTPVFPDTRVPIKHLFDYLEGGDSLETFLDQFPTVSRDQALALPYRVFFIESTSEFLGV
jgi:uncharacterized protein (DUF433 family)